MLSYMTTPGTAASPLGVAALALIGNGATATDLESRFSETGADLRPGVAEALLAELDSLGLVRIARGEPAREYVLRGLGRRLVGDHAWTEAAGPMRDLERMRTDFLSIIAHELRTPITVMRTLTAIGAITVGYPAPDRRSPSLRRGRRGVDEVVHRGRWEPPR